MILKFSTDLSKLDVYANGSELATIMGFDKDDKGQRVYAWPKEKSVFVHSFENPVLVTDNHKISQLESTLRDTIFALYNSPTPKINQYDGVSLEFDARKYKGVWGPSIDTFLFCKALSRMDLSTVKSAVEIGCGSGFISKYILERTAPKLEKILLIDWDKNAGDCIKDNITDNRASFFEGDATKILTLANKLGNKYDLIVSNPPYIRRPKSIDDNPYEGIGLLAFLIEQAPKLLSDNGMLVTNISSLSGELPMEIISRRVLHDRIVDSMDVPLKVYNVINNKEWMDYLLQHGLKSESKKGYDYWQKIMIHKIQPSRAVKA
ncbi:methyltransferase [Candidatus Woesearchaeota archaeon]|nr:methyltransferase [Candidatus Woesearchaeota archaeon]